jgi:hypothetical protein
LLRDAMFSLASDVSLLLLSLDDRQSNHKRDNQLKGQHRPLDNDLADIWCL